MRPRMDRSQKRRRGRSPGTRPRSTRSADTLVIQLGPPVARARSRVGLGPSGPGSVDSEEPQSDSGAPLVQGFGGDGSNPRSSIGVPSFGGRASPRRSRARAVLSLSPVVIQKGDDGTAEVSYGGNARAIHSPFCAGHGPRRRARAQLSLARHDDQGSSFAPDHI